MRTTATVARSIVGLTGITQVILGVLFWMDRALQLIPLHMVIGLTFVLAIWVLAGIAWRAKVWPAFAAGAALWGALVLALGATQTRLVPGRAHWIIEVLHLVVGLLAMAIAARLAKAIRRQLDAGAPAMQAVTTIGNRLEGTRLHAPDRRAL